MLPWFLANPQRLSEEREGVEKLATTAEWLVGADWHLENGLCLDVVLRVHDIEYELRVSFPAYYPGTPLVVRPLNQEVRLSPHQYGGADGPLCLQWGPDNWHPEITALQMIESAYLLLQTENPLGNKSEIPAVLAPSRHSLTISQELRGENVRWYWSLALKEFLIPVPLGGMGSLKFSFRSAGEVWISLIHEAASFDGSRVFNEKMPLFGNLTVGAWFKTDIKASELKHQTKWQLLRALLSPYGVDTLFPSEGPSPVENLEAKFTGILVLDSTGEPHFFSVFSDESIGRISTVRSEPQLLDIRCPDRSSLCERKVGIVGLGSAGSKIAVSLARMGTMQFYLCDPDVFLPENIHRHALDWTAVAQHKVDALSAALKMVSSEIQIKTSRIHLAGQESNAAVNGVLQKLASCDIIIDATASARVFNLLAAVATGSERPLVWLEIFGGGVGGLVARSRPGIDPPPQTMRGAYLQFCTDHPVPPHMASTTDYGLDSGGDEVQIASDADIALISHHAVRFVQDCFGTPSHSRFPYSMYLVGLVEGWIFPAPFATIPISMESFPVTTGPDNQDSLGADNAAFLAELLRKSADATDSSS